MSPRPDRRLNAATLASCVLLLTALAACGSGASEEPTSATDSSASSSESTSESVSPTDSEDSSSEGSGGSMPVGDTVEPGQALIVSTSNVDEDTSQLASALVDAQAVDTFLAEVDPRLAADVRSAVKDVQVPAGSTLFGSVVAVGCDRPTTVEWEKTFDGIEASAPMSKSGVQCLVPVTSVALFLVEDV